MPSPRDHSQGHCTERTLQQQLLQMRSLREKNLLWVGKSVGNSDLVGISDVW